MSSIKSLAGQTVWYGLSTILSRFIGFLLNPLITYLLNTRLGAEQVGEYAALMSAIPFLNVLFTYGMETAYFKFSNTEVDRGKLFQTSFSSIVITTLLLSAVFISFRVPIAHLFDIDAHPEYITWCVMVIALDTLSAIPFARLRQEGRPKKYAFTKVSGVLVNVICVVLLVAICPGFVKAHPHSAFAAWYGQYTNTGFLIMAFMVQSAVTFLLLTKEWLQFRFRLDVPLWRTILAYSLPFIVIGLGGMVNETMDRLMLLHYFNGPQTAAKQAVAIYNANYKLAIFITLFIQAFRMAAEPFFFNKAADKNAPATYAKVMKWFVITLCFAFLTTALFLDIWKYLNGSIYRKGLGVVPILLFANVALGIYYNLSVWYRITAQLRYGTGITLLGAAITIVLNYLFIPMFGMYACAWATLFCYTTMMVLCYFYGQKHFPVPYPVKKLLSYLGVILVLFLIHHTLSIYTKSATLHIAAGLLFTGLFTALIISAERRDLRSFPVIGKYL